jgi:hypothetical protein
MKDQNCLTEDQLLRAQELPQDHPQQHHLAACARCRSRLLSLESFILDDSVPEGARPDIADRQLSATISHITGTNRKTRPRTFWIGGGAVALAAVLAIFMIVPVTQGPAPLSTPSQVLRGNTVPDTWNLNTERNASGQLTLSWSPVEQAQSYLLTFLGADLQEIDKVEIGKATSWGPSSPPEGGLFWQVTARNGAEVLSNSGPMLLQP